MGETTGIQWTDATKPLPAERPCPECGGPMRVMSGWQGERRYVGRYLVCEKCGHTEPVK